MPMLCVSLSKRTPSAHPVFENMSRSAKGHQPNIFKGIQVGTVCPPDILINLPDYVILALPNQS